MNSDLMLFLSISFSDGVLALLVLIVRSLLKNSAPKAWQYYIWLIVALRLVLPFSPEISLSKTLFQHMKERLCFIKNFSKNKKMKFCLIIPITAILVSAGVFMGAASPKATAGTNDVESEEIKVSVEDKLNTSDYVATIESKNGKFAVSAAADGKISIIDEDDLKPTVDTKNIKATAKIESITSIDEKYFAFSADNSVLSESNISSLTADLKSMLESDMFSSELAPITTINTLPATDFFTKESAEISKEGKQGLDELAAFLKENESKK